MTDTTWAAKVLEGVPRFQTMSGNMLPEADALAAIAKLAEGDGLLASIAAITCPEAEAMSDRARLTALTHYADKAADHIAALTAQVKGLQRTYEDLYADALADAKSDAQDFESDLWSVVRAYLDELHFDWQDFMEDGVTADEAMTHIRECMNEETRRAEAAEAERAALRAKVAEHEKAAQENDPSNLWRFWANKAQEIADNIAALRAKVARLEGALDNIATELADVTPEPDNMEIAIHTAASVARAALEKGDKP